MELEQTNNHIKHIIYEINKDYYLSADHEGSEVTAQHLVVELTKAGSLTTTTTCCSSHLRLCFTIACMFYIRFKNIFFCCINFIQFPNTTATRNDNASHPFEETNISVSFLKNLHPNSSCTIITESILVNTSRINH